VLSKLQLLQTHNFTYNAIITPADACIFQSNSPPILTVFSNVDGVSCYANCIVQILLNVPEFIEEINCQDKPGPVSSQLQQLLIDIRNQQSPLCTLLLRCTVGEQYSQVEQRDAYEFLQHLLNKLATENSQIPDQIMGVEANEERCVNCDNTSVTGHTPFMIMNLHFTTSETTPVSFKKMLEQWLPFDRKCHLCGSPMERRTVITASSKFLFLAFCIFHDQNQKVIRPVTDFNENNITVGPNKFRTIAAVCHSGSTTNSGHYWCLLKKHNSWLYASDETLKIQKQFTKNLKDVYVILLEKILYEE